MNAYVCSYVYIYFRIYEFGFVYSGLVILLALYVYVVYSSNVGLNLGASNELLVLFL